MAGTVKLGGRDITVKTLTVSDVRELMEQIGKDGEKVKSWFDLDIVDRMFDDEVPVVAVARATGLSVAEVGGNYDPQEVRNLIDEVRAQNPFFVAMMERVVSAGKGGSAKASLAPSSKPSAT
ncbi:hypothetical protein [Desulfopila aestuarii]|uniref:Uncharacterized protein n=1 Tax=Desulfopila aestuarii DSM 18488 TaxID=1121416 RepID=A0A1M7YJN1_9BACT|nr:hypothetical protein [Desulfopila aestuarii]SHO52841.1 hypothetical protein SAMN02745220_04797 [Desulfopila aestuarii DSM 18488]